MVVSDSHRVFWETVGHLSGQRWKARVCTEHLCPQGVPARSRLGERGSNPMPLPRWDIKLLSPKQICKSLSVKIISLEKHLNCLGIRLGIHNRWHVRENAFHTAAKHKNKVFAVFRARRDDLGLARNRSSIVRHSLFTTSSRVPNPCRGTQTMIRIFYLSPRTNINRCFFLRRKPDCDGTSSRTRSTLGQPLGSRSRSFHSHLYIRQRMERTQVCSLFQKSTTIRKECDLIAEYFFQHGEVLDTSVGPRRVLGSVSDRHGVQTSLYGSLHDRNLEAREAPRTEHKAVFHAPSPTSCLLAFLERED